MGRYYDDESERLYKYIQMYNKVYKISNPDKVKNFIGNEVTVTGTITNDVLEIEKLK